MRVDEVNLLIKPLVVMVFALKFATFHCKSLAMDLRLQLQEQQQRQQHLQRDVDMERHGATSRRRWPKDRHPVPFDQRGEAWYGDLVWSRYTSVSWRITHVGRSIAGNSGVNLALRGHRASPVICWLLSGWGVGRALPWLSHWKRSHVCPKKMSETATQGLKLSKPSQCDFEMVSDPEPFVVKVWQMSTHTSHWFVNSTCSWCDFRHCWPQHGLSLHVVPFRMIWISYFGGIGGLNPTNFARSPHVSWLIHICVITTVVQAHTTNK